MDWLQKFLQLFENSHNAKLERLLAREGTQPTSATARVSGGGGGVYRVRGAVYKRLFERERGATPPLAPVSLGGKDI